jgi:hypothetical protein
MSPSFTSGEPFVADGGLGWNGGDAPDDDEGGAISPSPSSWPSPSWPSAMPEAAADPNDDDADVEEAACCAEAEADPAPEAASPATPTLPPGACPAPLGPGDLVVDELLIQSVAGTGDYGEWLEVASTLPCVANLRGLHGEAPSGAKVHTFDVTGDVWIPPMGSFVVADSDDATINHDLPGTLVVWSGQPGDVLRNLGTTVALTFQDTLIDAITYPSLRPAVGVSLAFPATCPLARRTDWTAWQPSTSSWFPGFFGTPNAPNDDVQCL